MTPLVTVGIPVYNGERYIGTALDSIQQQTLREIEILVADNGSTDASEEICRAAMKTDSRIRYLRSDLNRDGPWNLNRLFHAASAPLFKWAFYDDVCGPDLLKDCTEALLGASPEHVLAHARVRTIDSGGQITGEHDDAELGLHHWAAHRRLRELFVRNAEQALFGVVRLEALRRTSGIQRSVSAGHLILAELILQGPFVPVQDQSLFLRVHPGQHGGKRDSEMRWLAARRRERIFAYTRVTRRLAAAVLGSPLSRAEKARCLGVVARDWTVRTWRSSASDVKHLLSDLRETDADRAARD
jgi:glycosyltransferase involved in cell wall biosynthesis